MWLFPAVNLDCSRRDHVKACSLPGSHRQPQGSQDCALALQSLALGSCMGNRVLEPPESLLLAPGSNAASPEWARKKHLELLDLYSLSKKKKKRKKN